MNFDSSVRAVSSNSRLCSRLWVSVLSAVFLFSFSPLQAEAKKEVAVKKVETETGTKKEAETKAGATAKKPAEESGEKKMTAQANPVVVMETSLGNVEIELNAEKAPISVENFLKYVNDGFYTGTLFHRVISTFMIQGGGFDEKMSQKPVRASIKNEAGNGLKNDKGTVAMARTNVVDSATAQFFINVKDNDFLNHSGPSNYGYAVFGKVISGMDIVEKIKAVPTTFKGGMEDVPVTPVVIKSMKKK